MKKWFPFSSLGPAMLENLSSSGNVTKALLLQSLEWIPFCFWKGRCEKSIMFSSMVRGLFRLLKLQRECLLAPVSN